VKIQYFGNVKIHYLMEYLYFIQSKTSILERTSRSENVFPNNHLIFFLYFEMTI